MKNYLFIATSFMLLTACNQDELNKSKSDLTQASYERDSLMALVENNETTLNDFITSFNEVENNLHEVAVKQQIISLNTEKGGEVGTSQKARINSEIKAINQLMEKNRNEIAELSRKLRNSGSKNAAFEKAVASLNEQLVQKDVELLALNERLNELNMQMAQLKTSVDTLTMLSSNQSQTITDRTMALHTAYYIIGKAKDLREAKLVDRKGGLLGIGKTSKLSDNFDKSKFTQIDYTVVSNIPVNSDRVKIITTHPAGSYRLEHDPNDMNKVKTLVITNPEQFWSASRFLVIEGVPVMEEIITSSR